jgi:hypothetical protein
MKSFVVIFIVLVLNKSLFGFESENELNSDEELVAKLKGKNTLNIFI